MKTKTRFKTLILLLICASIVSCGRKPADLSVVHSDKYKESVNEVCHQLGLFSQSNFIPGLAVAVSIDNQVVLADGFGYSNYELKRKASPSNMFRIGQVTELMTALTAAKLCEDGKLQLDKPVAAYLPEMKLKSADFTIRQLGAHSAGIKSEIATADKQKFTSLETLIPSFLNDDLVYAPGSKFVCSGLGFDLIGYLIEKNSTESYAKIVQKTVADPLKLTGTYPDDSSTNSENKCSTYEYNSVSQPAPALPIDLRGKEASIGYTSTVLDLAKIGNSLIYPGFLSKKSIDLLTTPFKLTDGRASLFGFGLIVGEDNKKQIYYGQIGKIKGGCAALLIFPEDKLVIAIAANIDNSSWELPVYEIARVFQNQMHPKSNSK